MGVIRAAIRYAKAILDLAKQQHSTEAVNADMKSVVEAIAVSKDLNNMLQSPIVPSEKKKSALLAVFPGFNDLTVKLIDTLIQNERLNIFGDVAQKYMELYDQSQGTQVAKVTTAVPLTDDLKAQVLKKIKELTGKDAELKNVVDESILGGFILRVGDIQYDASIAHKLNKLKREFTLN